MWQEIVQWWWSIAPYLKTPALIVISLIALSVTFWDRRPRLLVRPRKGSTHNPYKLCPTAKGGLAFLGGIEVYNLSGRPNAIRGYAFWQKNDDGAWIVMESQNYKESSEDETFIKRNETPVTVAPYSGTEVRVLAFASVKHRPSEMPVRIEAGDRCSRRASPVLARLAMFRIAARVRAPAPTWPVLMIHCLPPRPRIFSCNSDQPFAHGILQNIINLGV